MIKTYSTLVAAIRDAVRKKAQEIPMFRESGNGAIRILAYPCCKNADIWISGSSFNHNLSDFSDPERPDITDYEHTFAITPGGSRVITGVWDGVSQKVDCYAYSALKIADCSYAQDAGLGLLSGLVHDFVHTEDNGYGPHAGAICVEVKFRGKDYCGFYVCVSGAQSSQDLACASVAIDVIRDHLKAESVDFSINAPTPAEIAGVTKIITI